MKIITLIILFAACQMLAADDTNLVAAGDWSQPVATQYGPAIRGRLLICDTPNHASSDPKPDTAVYLELQEFASALRSVRVYCGLNRFTVPDDSPGLRCELRDSAGKLIHNSPGSFSGGEPGSYWVTLQPYCSARLRASVYGGDDWMTEAWRFTYVLRESGGMFIQARQTSIFFPALSRLPV